MKTQSIQMSDGAKLAFWERAAHGTESGAPVLLLHSLFFGHGMFDGVVSRLDGRRRIVAPDFRGQGASAATPSAPSMSRLADDVVALIESELRTPVHLVGSSMGGYVAQELMLRRPDLVASCVLACCSAEAEADPQRFAALEQRVRSDGPAAIVDELMNVMFGEHFVLHGPSAERSRWRAHFAALPHQVADAVHGVFSRPAYLDQLADIQLPVLLISGALDRAKRPADMAQIAERIVGSEHLVFEHSGHTPAIEEPERFALALQRFWHAVDGRGAAH